MMLARLDPFEVRQHSKLHPARLCFTAAARLAELYSRARFPQVALPTSETLYPPLFDYDTADTAVTPEQMGALIHFVHETEGLAPKPIVEIGAYRGSTTLRISKETSRQIYAVDPYMGYGGAEDEFQRFQGRTSGVSNIQHIRATSGAAAGLLSDQISLCFIDAVHDFVNTGFDIESWGAKLAPGGILALHDTDNADYPGTRLAATLAAKRFRLVHHIHDLTILQRD